MKALGIFFFWSSTVGQSKNTFSSTNSTMGSSDIHFLVVVFYSSNWPVAISYFTLKETSLIEVNQRTQSDVCDEPFAGSTGGVCFRQSDNQKEGCPRLCLSSACSLFTFTNVLLISSWLISKPFSCCTEAKGRAENRYSHLGCKNSSWLTVQCMSPRSRGREKGRRFKRLIGIKAGQENWGLVER